MRRTLQTAVEALDWLVGARDGAAASAAAAAVPIRAHAGWQETTDHPCDVGSDIAELAREFPSVDFGDVDPVFPDKTSEQARAYSYSRSALVARAQSVLAELHRRPEDVVLVVSHSAFLSKAVSGAMFGNADYRVFSFAEVGEETAEGTISAAAAAAETTAASDSSAPHSTPTKQQLCPPPAVVAGLPPLRYRLREWEETRKSHGGMGRSFDTVREIGEGLPERG